MKFSLLHPAVAAQSLKQLLFGMPGLRRSNSESKTRDAGTSLPPGLVNKEHSEASETDSLWLETLGKVLDAELSRGTPNYQKPEQSSVYTYEQIERLTVEEMSFLQSVIEGLASEFNKILSNSADLDPLHVTTVRFLVPGSHSAAETWIQPSDRYRRCRATSSTWSLTLRGLAGVIDIFLVPANELFSQARSETAERLRASLQLNCASPNKQWQIDLFPSTAQERILLMRQLFKELVINSARKHTAQRNELSGSHIPLEPEALKNLLLTQQNLAQKIVSQHEELTHAIARDLHDVVIAELILLKKAFESERPVNPEEINSTIELLSTRLREICYDLAPRDLDDWGLQTVVQDLLERIGSRAEAEYSLVWNGDLPKLQRPVQLHIYRITQECLNNIAKYADATKIEVRFDIKSDMLTLTVSDNGKGFSTSAERTRGLFDGGTGLSTISERTEMIRCFHPATLSINSDPGKGTTTKLEIRLTES
jgi:signal transduction histidine kinase